MKVPLCEANTQLSKLIQQALAGQERVIARAGRPLVRIVRLAEDQPILGSAKGAFTLNEDWDAPLRNDEILETFGN